MTEERAHSGRIPEMLQDASRGLSKALSQTPGARLHAEEAAAYLRDTHFETISAAELSALRKKAERYDYLRERNAVLGDAAIFTARRMLDESGRFDYNDLISGDEMDAVIDSAIEKEKSNG